MNVAIQCIEDQCKGEGSCVSLIQCLLDEGANPNIKDSYNRTPLSRAVHTEGDNNKKVVELLLGAGADPNIMVEDASDYETTTLYMACGYCGKSFNVETMELLLKNGADVNKIVDNRENTILHEIVGQSFGISDRVPILKKQLLGLIELLIKHGANIYIKNKSGETPIDLIDRQLHGHSMNDRNLVLSVQKLLKEQEHSVEYSKRLIELVDKNKDFRSLVNIIKKNGPIDIRGLQVCSKVIPKILGISGIKLVVKGTIVEGEFSQGTEWPVIEVEGNLPKYFDLFEKICVAFPEHPLTKARPEVLFHSPQEELMWGISRYIRENQGTIKKELWGEHEITPETDKGGDATRQHVAQKESDKDDHDTIPPELPGGRKTVDNKEKRYEVVNNTSHTDRKPMVAGRSPINSSGYPQKEPKNPPIFSRKQKIAIAIGVVTALATALVCYSLQLPALAIVASTLIAGIGAYVVSSKFYDVSVCNGASQQPGL
ncbi:MAG: ankyrin repeat domain-containing protein [Rickettsiales bacterium]|nr:ankyrin repeat domain-containing protein [Rickettsiales bacterium]MDR1261440.1 ankyrin repeat domain-containing protein [Rickettsiales bacterium]